MISSPDFIRRPSHGGVIIPIAAIVFSSLLFPRTLAFSPGVAGLAFYAFWPWQNGTVRPRPGIVFFFALAVTFCATLSAFWSVDPGYAAGRSAKIALVLIPGALWITALSHFSDQLKTSVLRAVTVITFAMSVLFTGEFLLDYPLMRLMNTLSGSEEGFRYYDLNRSIVALVFAFLPVLVFLYRGRILKGWPPLQAFGICAAFSFLLLPVLALTQSQSAQIAFLAGVFFMVFFPVRCRLAWLGLGATLCLGLLSAPFLAIAAFDIVTGSAIANDANGSWLQSANVLPRLEIWDFVSRYILDHAWIGSGVEATRMVAAFDNHELYQPGLTLLHPHNAVLQIWMEFGLMGAILSCAVITLVLGWMARQSDPLMQRLFLGMLVAFGAVGMVGYGIWQGWWLGLIMFSIGLSSLVSPEKKSSSQPAAVCFLQFPC